MSVLLIFSLIFPLLGIICRSDCAEGIGAQHYQEGSHWNGTQHQCPSRCWSRGNGLNAEFMKSLLGWVLGHLPSLLGKSKQLRSCVLRGLRSSTERAVTGSSSSAHMALVSTSAESPTKLQMWGQSAGVPAIKEQTCQCPSSTLDVRETAWKP